MGREYKQLEAEDRSVIAVGLAQGLSRRAIALLLKRPVSTISREINRNGEPKTYLPQDAAARCKGRQFRRKKILSNAPLLWLKIQVLLGKGWSPEQVAGKLKRMHPDDPSQHVSHETIYAHIYAYPRGGLHSK